MGVPIQHSTLNIEHSTFSSKSKGPVAGALFWIRVSINDQQQGGFVPVVVVRRVVVVCFMIERAV
jgi:hypothetical protein